MQTILVTGCAGFIGSHLSKALLASGAKVVGVDNFDPFYPRVLKEQNLSEFLNHENFKFYELDLVNRNDLDKLPNTIDVVIHLAAKAGVLPSIKDPNGYIQSNIVGTNNVLDFMKKIGCNKLLFASSSSVYGNNKKVPFSEEDQVDEPISPYAFTKRSCELMNYNYHVLYDIDIINLRFFTVYGPKQRPDLAIHKFFKLISNDMPIQMYGDGSTARDYTYVDDTVHGILQALQYISNTSGVFETVNLGNNSPIELKDLIQSIYAICGKSPNIQQQDMKPGDVNITYADISKAQNMFGYNPKTSFLNGIEKFKEWYEQSNS